VIEQRSDVNPFDEETAMDALRGLPSFEEPVSRLLYLAENGQPCGIVRGPAGVGKTPLLHCVIRELRRSGQECGFVDLRRTSDDELAWTIASELGTVPSRGAGRADWRLVDDAIQGRALSGRATVLLVDHLGERGAASQMELQRVLAIAESSAGWCTVLGAARSDMPAVDRFVWEHSGLRIDLSPLSQDETRQYFSQLVELSGCAPFSDESVSLLHEYSQGVLRVLASLGRLAILAGSSEAAPTVTAEMISLVAAEVTSPLNRHRVIPQAAVVATID
jgi:type II secretory pathway predicted ATPase ExeA